ncbi:MAG: DUF4386 domain-containing protein [Gemmatimonadaceae bacterium]|nr:DUF4386 domain-containing protein [Gemmatimonadaceae bacterium]
MNPRKQTARLAGVLYVLMGFAGAFSIMFIPRTFVVRGDAAATADNIASSPLLYRFGIVSDLVNQAGFVLLVLVLYDLFKDVNRRHALLMVALVLVQVAMTFAIMITQIAPLILLSGADYLSVFEQRQLEALALGSLSLRSHAIVALGAYMGLWLLPFGALVYRSRFIPRIFGTLLLVAGVAYVINTLAFFLLPDYRRVISLLMMLPYAAGEGSIVFWLLIKGARVDPEIRNRVEVVVPSLDAGVPRASQTFDDRPRS